MRRHLFVIVALISSLLCAQDRTPLREFRNRFLNQRVIVKPDFSSTPRSRILSWRFVKEKKRVYHVNYSKDVPASLVGQIGTIIAVQSPDDNSSQADNTYVEYAEAIVKLDSGELLRTSISTLSSGTEDYDSFNLVSARDKKKQETIAKVDELQKNLQGKSLYLTAMTNIYDEGFNPKSENLSTIKAGVGHSEALIRTAPFLTPLPVLDVRYFDSLDYTQITLQLPNGRKAYYILGCVVDEISEKHFICASTSLPTFITKPEIEAIRNHSVFIGMSENALNLSRGLPEKSNESLVGPTQLIYPGSYIYIQDKVVVEIQSR